MVNCLGLSDTILQCDPEPSLIKWEESAKSKTSRANSHPKLSKIITSQQRSSGKLSETVAGTSAHNAGSTSRPHDEMDCSTCSLAHPSFHEKRCTASILSSHGWSVSWKSCWCSANLCLLAFQRWEKALGIPHRSWLTDGNPLCGWARATSDEHLVRTDEGVVS